MANDWFTTVSNTSCTYQSHPLCVSLSSRLKSYYNKLHNKDYYALFKKIWRSNFRFVGTANHELPFYGKKKIKMLITLSDEEKDDKHALPLFSSKILHFVTLKRMFLHFLSWASIRVLCKFQEVTVSEEEHLSQEQGKKAKPSNPDPTVLITFLQISGFA